MMQTLWAFRTRITLQDLTSTLNNVPDVKHKYPLLHKFLQEVWAHSLPSSYLGGASSQIMYLPARVIMIL